MLRNRFFKKKIKIILPSFMIIGAQRSGTTSLHTYLIGHPQLTPPQTKEVHYFDVKYHQGLKHYQSYFRHVESGQITWDASPYYLFHPLAPARANHLLPKAKLIVLLRNPIERAISQYNFSKRIGVEALSIDEAFYTEEQRLLGKEAQFVQNPHYRSKAYRHWSYLARSVYVPQLERWLNYYPREQMLILKSEDLFADPARILAQVLGFIGIDATWQPAAFEVMNATQKTTLDPDLQAWLVDYFAPHNAELAAKFGIHFD